MFNPSRKGVAASRLDAVDFVKVLEGKHESAGLKSLDEDLILLLLQAGSVLTGHKWLSEVTSALIVPPPILGLQDESVAMKLANAVSFHTEGTGKRTSFDKMFASTITEPTASDMNLSNGQSYPTPALNGAAVALRLGTFLNLPAQDRSLMDPWAANLDLSLNLWLCGDGIDIIEDVEIKSSETPLSVPLDPEMAARFAAVWMDPIFQQRFFQSYSSQITRLDWETKVTKASQSDTIPKDLSNRCRSFEWYVKEVNPDLSKILEQSGWESHREEEEKRQTETKKIEVSPEKQEPPSEPKKDIVAAAAAAVAANVVKEPEKVPPVTVKEGEGLVHESHDAVPEGQAAEGGIPDLARNDKKKPSKPLRPENLKILSSAKPIDIAFLDVSGGHTEHPHMGATDESGAYGYIHDETALRKNPPKLVFANEELSKACTKKDDNYRMMSERVIVDLEYDKNMEDSGARRDKIFCLVYTTEEGHNKIPNIRETWG
jgi:hypothetical protein